MSSADVIEHIARGCLPGLYFHTLSDGRVQHQGRVEAILPDGEHYLCTFMSWIDGDHYSTEIRHVSDMVRGEWRFFGTAAEMRNAYEEHTRSRGRG